MCVSVDVNRCQLMSIDVKWCQMCQWISFALPSPLRFLFWAGPCLLASLTEAPSSRKTTQAKRAMIARSTPGLVNLRVEKTVVWDDMSHACPSLALDRNSVWLWVYARMTDEQVSGWFMMILDNSGCSWCMFWWCSSWESHQGSAGRAIWPFSSTSATSGAMHWKESPRKGKHLSIKDAFRYNDLFWMPTVAKPMAPSAHLYIYRISVLGVPAIGYICRRLVTCCVPKSWDSLEHDLYGSLGSRAEGDFSLACCTSQPLALPWVLQQFTCYISIWHTNVHTWYISTYYFILHIITII